MKCELQRDLLGAAIRKARIERGLSQEELAEIIDVTPTHMKHIESGHRLPSMEVLYQIVLALRMSLDAVFLPSDNDNSDQYNQLLCQLRLCSEQQINVLYATVNAMLNSKE